MVAGAKGHEQQTRAWDQMDEDTRTVGDRFRGSFSGYERNRLFVPSAGQQTRVEASAVLGLDFDHDGRSVAPIDFDGDGDLDLAIMSLQGLQLVMNSSPRRNWARLTLEATTSEPMALGAQVIVRAGDRAQLDRVRLTAGFHTQVSPELHFGLGDADTFDLEVRWPTGTSDTHRGLRANRRYEIAEGRRPDLKALPAWSASNRPTVGRRFDVGVEAKTLDGAAAKIAAGGPVLVNFWAPWCEGCDREMPALAELARRGKLSVVGVSAEVKDVASVRAFLAKHGVDYGQRLATDAAVASFFGGGGEMTLPASFLFDGNLKLRRTWLRTVDVAEIEAALADAPVSAEDYMSQAEMFMARRDYISGLQAMREAVRLDPDEPLTRTNLAVAALTARVWPEAEAAAREVLKRSPTEARAWEVLVLALEGAGRDRAARAATRDGLKRLPDDPFLRGRTLPK